MSLVSNREKIDRVITEPHCIWFTACMASPPDQTHPRKLSSAKRVWNQLPYHARGVASWVPFQYKDRLCTYGDSQHKDKTVTRPSYLYNGHPYAGLTAFLYWDDPCSQNALANTPKVKNIKRHKHLNFLVRLEYSLGNKLITIAADMAPCIDRSPAALVLLCQRCKISDNFSGWHLSHSPLCVHIRLV